MLTTLKMHGVNEYNNSVQRPLAQYPNKKLQKRSCCGSDQLEKPLIL